MSTHRVDVVEIGDVLPHPNADKLEMVKVGEYTCLIPKGQFKRGDLAAYIEPDFVVPDLPAYEFLGGKRRIGAKRLRGVWSEGLLVRAPDGAVAGANVMEALGVTRWEPPVNEWRAGGHSGPPLGAIEHVPPEIAAIPKYDLENLKRHANLFREGEPVYVTEKLHGTNARYVFHEGQMYCGSRSLWRKQEPKNVYWDALEQNAWVRGYCEAHPGTVLMGEIFGDVQDMMYGFEKGQYVFKCFDVLTGRRWRIPMEVSPALQSVPVLAEAMPFSMEVLKEMAEKDSVFGGVCEGVVVQPAYEDRWDPHVGRVKMKLVSNRYLSR